MPCATDQEVQQQQLEKLVPLRHLRQLLLRTHNKVHQQPQPPLHHSHLCRQLNQSAAMVKHCQARATQPQQALDNAVLPNKVCVIFKEANVRRNTTQYR
jgi:hypothetical protein